MIFRIKFPFFWVSPAAGGELKFRPHGEGDHEVACRAVALAKADGGGSLVFCVVMNGWQDVFSTLPVVASATWTVLRPNTIIR